MPLVEVTLVQGRTPQQLRALLHELHGAVVRSIGAPPENVRIVIREVPATHWAAGDVTIAERSATTSREKLNDGLPEVPSDSRAGSFDLAVARSASRLSKLCTGRSPEVGAGRMSRNRDPRPRRSSPRKDRRSSYSADPAAPSRLSGSPRAALTMTAT